MESPSAPAAVVRDWVVFDTNAVRSLASLPEATWSGLRVAWMRAGLRTAWAPPTVVEIAGTNLVRQSGLDSIGLSDVQRAVSRFDDLAHGEIGVDELVRRSFYELADMPVPPSPVADHTHAWRDILDALVSATSPDQVVVSHENGKLTVRIVPRDVESGWEVVIPSGFERFVRARVAAMAARTDDATTLEQRVARDLPLWGITLGERFGVPRDIVLAALSPARKERLFRSPFAMRAVCEIAYDFDRLPGGKSRVVPNDQIDLALTTYLFDNRTFVTDDRPLVALLRGICADQRRIVGSPLGLVHLNNADLSGRARPGSPVPLHAAGEGALPEEDLGPLAQSH
jgi:hypothetical protein